MYWQIYIHAYLVLTNHAELFWGEIGDDDDDDDEENFFPGGGAALKCWTLRVCVADRDIFLRLVFLFIITH